jgi:hypothetical protein
MHASSGTSSSTLVPCAAAFRVYRVELVTARYQAASADSSTSVTTRMATQALNT